jgi:hypothetical protein
VNSVDTTPELNIRSALCSILSYRYGHGKRDTDTVLLRTDSRKNWKVRVSE